jgi:hypothetical protein
VSIPALSGAFGVEVRVGLGSAQTCDFYKKAGDADTIYRREKQTIECANGIYEETRTYALDMIVNGSGSCSAPDLETTFDPDFSYGALVDITYEYSLPVDSADVLAAAAVVWGDWTDLDELIYSGGAGIFSALAGRPGWESAAAQQLVAVVQGIGVAHVLANKTQVQVRLKLLHPLAVTVKYEIGSLGVGDGGDYTWGSETEIVLTPAAAEQTVDLPLVTDVIKRLRFSSFVFHPLT